MKISVWTFYAIWTLLQMTILNFAISTTTDFSPSLLGSFLFVMFFQVSVVIPALSIVSNAKNENNKL
jgi:hypothetical protein